MKQDNFIIDLFKIICSQLIVLHHFLGYGAISNVLQGLLGSNGEVIFEYSRMVVQIFLVVGGYLAISVLSRYKFDSFKSFVHLIIKRYIRLVVPFVIGISLAILSSFVAREVYLEDYIPEAPTFFQLLSHLLLLHGVLGFDSLSSGVWYVAIDFQLFLVVAFITYLNKHKINIGLYVALIVLSLYWFNRDSDFDNIFIYFFGAYGIGVLSNLVKINKLDKAHYLIMLALFSVSLLIEFRERILIALVTGFILSLDFKEIKSNILIKCQPLIRKLSEISYILFLTHFSVLVLSNTLFNIFEWPKNNLYIFLGLVWLVCMLLALVTNQFSVVLTDKINALMKKSAQS